MEHWALMRWVVHAQNWGCPEKEWAWREDGSAVGMLGLRCWGMVTLGVTWYDS